VAADQWLPIVYSGYWDVPGPVFVLLPTATITLDSDFIEDLDDYDANYVVRVLPPMQKSEFLGSRTPGLDTAPVVGRIPVSTDLFDPTRRAAIRREPLDSIGLSELIDAEGPR
jgi:hypothetical protein